MRLCALPLIVMRHSKQIPIPQSGPRGAPPTDTRHGCPASIAAAATVVPGSTSTVTPLTVRDRLGMGMLHSDPGWQIRLNGNFWFRTRYLIDENTRSSERSGDAKALVASR